MGLCLVVVSALSAVAVASAAAFSPPEVGRCVKVAVGTGKFTSGTCIKEKAGSSYEWLPGAVKNKFNTTGGVGTLATVNGTTVICKTQGSGGEFNSPKTVTGVTVRFTGCESAGFHCTTAGSAQGEIVTNPLEGRIGVENKLKKKLALDLFPTSADGGLYVTFNCGVSLHITVGGSVLVNLPSDKMLTSMTLKYTATKGHQKPEHLEGEPNDVLITEINSVKPEQSGITITSTQVAEEALEANALF
jgi:opacity protein-like surface antigen